MAACEHLNAHENECPWEKRLVLGLPKTVTSNV